MPSTYASGSSKSSSWCLQLLSQSDRTLLRIKDIYESGLTGPHWSWTSYFYWVFKPQSSSDMSPLETERSALHEATDSITNGPILLPVDQHTPECLYLISPPTRAITLGVEGAVVCQEVGDLAWGIQPESSGRKFFHFYGTLCFFTSLWLGF